MSQRSRTSAPARDDLIQTLRSDALGELRPRRARTRAGRAPWALWVLWAALLVGVLGAGAAQAAEPQSGEDGQVATDPCLNDTLCRGHYDEARQAYKDKRYEEALREYRAAYERRQAPWLLINVGRSLQRLGRLDESLDYYQRYLRADPNPKPEVKTRVEEYIAQVQAGIESAPKKEPEPAPLLTAAPVAATQPTGQPEGKPVYKKWSYKKFFLSDGAGCWNGRALGGRATLDTPIDAAKRAPFGYAPTGCECLTLTASRPAMNPIRAVTTDPVAAFSFAH